jgi:molybdopterin converting factor small subunit
MQPVSQTAGATSLNRMTGSASGPADNHDDGQPVMVLFFASAREAAGTARAPVAFAGRTVAELTAELISIYGTALRGVLASCAIWVNGEPAGPTYLLRAGDEVAVLPPVSGGS